MKERPILFGGPMVQAILDGRKTQTRRAIKHFDGTTYAKDPAGVYWKRHSKEIDREQKWWAYPIKSGASALPVHGLKCPYGEPGDRLWVRETWAHDGPDLETVRARVEDMLPGGETYGPYYRATEVAPETLRWRPAIHMPRWACRIVLTVQSVRIERLQDISGPDALAEGVGQPVGTELAYGHATDAWNQRAYSVLWEQINGTGSWEKNPWVWVIEFKRAAAALREAA